MRKGTALRAMALLPSLALCGCVMGAVGAGAIVPGKALEEPYAAGLCASVRAGLASVGASVTYVHMETTSGGSPADLVLAAGYGRLSVKLAEIYAGGGIGYEDPDADAFSASEGDFAFLELGAAVNLKGLGVRASYAFFPWSDNIEDAAFVLVEYLF